MLSLTACPDSSGKSRLSADKAGNEGKKFFITCLILSTVLLTYTLDAQDYGLFRKPSNVTLPEKIQGPLGDPIPAGTYSIGTGGYFPTIDSAFNKLSIDGVAGNVTLELIDELYVAPAVQFGFLLNGPIPGAGPNSRVTIKPAENKNVVIQGNREAVLFLVNTSYVTFDGVSTTGPTTLTIHALQNSAYTYNDGLDFINNSDHNIIQNIIFDVEDNTRESGSGFWFTQTGSAPDSNLIQNNYVKSSGIALFVISASTNLRGKGNVVRGNLIGSETDSLVADGIAVNRCENSIIEDNVIQNLKITYIGVNAVQTGVTSSFGFGDIIRNNVIHNLRATSGRACAGIFLAGDVGNRGDQNQVYNNMVYNIQSTSAQYNSKVGGILMWHQNNPKIFYNSVYLSGVGANPEGSAALYIHNSCSNVDVKNNIFVNTRDESPYCASAIYDYTAANLTSDYNDLYYDNTNANNCLIRIASIKYNSLSAWQATGKDFHSVSVMPCFSGSNLHIDVTEATCLESRGTPIPGFDTDFDGESRHQYLPDIGADEFDGLRPTGAITYGAYSVGNHGFFTSIENVFEKLRTDGIDGAVTLELNDELYTATTDSFGFKLNGPIAGAGPTSRVTIKPAENKNVTVEGNGEGVFHFNKISYLTLDGVGISGPTTLTVHNLVTIPYSYNDAITFIGNCKHNIVKNTTAITEDIIRPSAGITFWPDGSVLGTPDSNLVQNNFIRKATFGFYIGANTFQTSKASGNIIRDNMIGSETDSLITFGIQAERVQNTIIENNVIRNIKRQSILFSNLNAYTFGINTYAGNETVIRNNVIYDINSSAMYGSTGILLSGESWEMGSNNAVYNNMIYDIQSSSTNNESRVSGIQIFNQNNPQIYYNSINLSGTGANKYGSAALYFIYGGVTNADVKNNILVNTRDESPYCASTIYNYTAGNLTSDYNDLYYDNTNANNCLVRISSTNYHTLADWQATGKDIHSVTEMPNFKAPYLHIVENEPTLLESRGTPIAGIDKDFDGQTRHETNPDIGADEFNGIVVGVDEEETLPTEYVLLQNYPNPFNPSTKISWQSPVGSHQTIKVYDVLGNEVATLVDEYKPAGRYEVEFSIHSGESANGGRKLSSGVYFYQLKAREFMSVKKMILLK